MKEKAPHFLGLGFLFCYPFLRFVFHHDYPPWRVEILVYVGAWLCLVLLLVKGAGNPFWTAFFYFFLFLLFLTTAPGTIGPNGLWARGGVCLILALLFWKFPQKMVRLLCIFIVGVFLTDLGIIFLGHGKVSLSAQSSSVPPSGEPGHILYLILDEHIGLDGMPPAVSETAAMQKKLTSFYRDHQFTVYTKAYSSYFYSDNSISNIFNRTYLTDKDAYFSKDEDDDVRVLMENCFFDKKTGEGYRINVYQPNYIDFCSSSLAPGLCYRYRKNSILSVKDEPLGRLEKTWIVGSLFIASNSIFREIEKRAKDRNIVKMRTGALHVVPELLKRVKEDMLVARGPTLFFAHVLMPHYPYVYDAQCRVRPVADWRNRNEFNEANRINSQSGYRERYRLYYEQIECLNQWLGSLFDELKKAGLYDRMTIVIHGDHGSRINLAHDPYSDYYLSLSREDMVTSFSALLAVKLPGDKEGRVNREMGDIGRILGSVLDEKNEYHEQDPPVVYLKQKKGKRELVKVPMPRL